LCAVTLIANNVWLWPQRFYFESGETAIITQRSGSLQASSSANNPNDSSILITHYLPDKQISNVPITQENQASNTIMLPNLQLGSHMLTQASVSRTLNLATDSLHAYLKQHRLNPINNNFSTSHVRWHNCAKTIIQVGAPITNNLTVNIVQPTTLDLDIIPLTHPYELTTNNNSFTGKFQVRFNGTALANQPIVVWQANAAEPQIVTTNKKGQVTITTAKGNYMLTTYYSVMAADTLQPIVEAYFGSLTVSTPRGNFFIKRNPNN